MLPAMDSPPKPALPGPTPGGAGAWGIWGEAWNVDGALVAYWGAAGCAAEVGIAEGADGWVATAWLVLSTVT